MFPGVAGRVSCRCCTTQGTAAVQIYFSSNYGQKGSEEGSFFCFLFQERKCWGCADAAELFQVAQNDGRCRCMIWVHTEPKLLFGAGKQMIGPFNCATLFSSTEICWDMGQEQPSSPCCLCKTHLVMGEPLCVLLQMFGNRSDFP